MKCPNCNREVFINSKNCPYCRYELQPVSEENKKIDNVFANINRENENVQSEETTTPKKEHNSEKFFIGIILLGIIVLAFLIINQFVIKDEKRILNQSSTTSVNTTSKEATLNKGERSTYDYPLSVGQTTLASIYDSEADVYTDVDVTGIRFLDASEAAVIAQNQAAILHDGFEWQAFIYEVSLNDLHYLNEKTISPILNAKLYKWGGNDYFIYNGHHYFIDVKTVYDSIKIKNSDKATITVYYEVPIGETSYSLCLGNELYTLGCFSKFIT